jgi:small subunit ribosomal protein S1
MLKEGVEGLIHISDMSWNKDIKDPSETVNVGDKVKVKILSIDPDKQKVSLGLKQLEDNPFSKYPVGFVVKSKIKTVQRSGAYLDLENGLEAYLRVSSYSRERVADLRDHLNEGDELEAKIIKSNPEKKYIEVSVKDLLMDQEKQEMRKYMDTPGNSGATIYDLIGDKLDGLTEEEND